MGKVHYERIQLRRRYQEGGEVDPYDPLAASAGVAPASTPTIDQIPWGQPSWLEQAGEQSRRDQEAFAKEGVRGVLQDTEGTQDLAGGFSDAGFAGTIKAFHGSPHNFERFDIGKVGTGEGGAAYGHGIYAAENPTVAEEYRKAFDARSGSEADARVYEVNINANPEHFLDWDKPLSEQSEHVRNVLRQLGFKEGPTELGEFAGQKIRGAPQSGAEIYKTVSPTVSRTVNSRLGPYTVYPKDEAAASQLLREAGVPGIRYLDQGSRGSGAGTHNYVVFDDKLIDIIKKYGLAGLIAAGAAHFTAPADEAPGMARGGAAPADDANALTDEDRAAIQKGWLEVIEDAAHQGRTHYTMPDVRSMPAPGSFRVPKDVIAQLGDGDLKVGGFILQSLFGIEDAPERPDLIHPHAVRIIGNGSLAAGTKTLTRFVQMIRRQSREGVTLVHDGLQHDDGHHGWRVAR